MILLGFNFGNGGSPEVPITARRRGAPYSSGSRRLVAQYRASSQFRRLSVHFTDVVYHVVSAQQ